MLNHGDPESTEKTEKKNAEYGPQMNTDGTQIKTSKGAGNPSNPYAAPQTVNCQKANDRPYYLRFSFWLSAAFGWFAAAILLGLIALFTGLTGLEGYKSIAVGVIVHVLAALIGFFDARWRWNQKNKITT